MSNLPGGYVQDIINRTKDVSDVVRKQAYCVLAAKSSLADLSIQERALLLRRGLHDRSSSVVVSAVAMLQTWLLQSCGESILDLLSNLDVRQFPGKTSCSMMHTWWVLSFL